MKKYIDNIIKYRFLLGELVKKGIKLKYRRSYLGILWTLLEPIMTTMVLAFVFSTFFSSSIDNFLVYILTGRLVYSFFSQGTNSALRSVRSNAGMIKKVYVPKYLYPLSSVLFNYVIFAISLIVLAGALILKKIPLTMYAFEVIIPLVLLFFLTFGIGLILATGAVFFRDLEYLWNVALLMIMYMSAIFYDAQRIVDAANKNLAAGENVIMSKLQILMFDVNPLYGIIKCIRDTLVYGKGLDWGCVSMISIWCVVTMVIGGALFLKKQDRFILYI